MSQPSQLRNRKGKSVTFEEPVSTQAGPSSSALNSAGRSSSIQAAPMPTTQATPIPSIQVAPPLSIYRPVSREYRGPQSTMQAAWAAAPKPKSFLEAIAQTKAIREGTLFTSADVSQLSNPVTMPPATVPKPDWPADIITPPLQPAFPVQRSSTTRTTDHVTQSVGPIPTSGSSSSIALSGNSSPHLGSGLIAQGTTGPPSSLHPGQFAVPAWVPSNYPPIVPSVSTSPHLGSGLSTVMDAETASSLRLAQVFGSRARPNQPHPYVEPGYYGPETEPRKQGVGFSGQPSYQPSNQAPPFGRRATNQLVPQPQTRYFGFESGSSFQPSGSEEPAAYGPPPMQYMQSAPIVGYHQPSPYNGRQSYSPSPEPPIQRSGSAASSRNQPTPLQLGETYEPEPNARAALLEKLEQAKRQYALSALRVEVRRKQLHDNDVAQQELQKIKSKEESDRFQQEEEHFQQEDDHQWHQIERRGAKKSHRR